MTHKHNIEYMLVDSLEWRESDHSKIAVHGQSHDSQVYALLRDIESAGIYGDRSSLPRDLHQLAAVGKLADELEFALRSEHLRGSF